MDIRIHPRNTHLESVSMKGLTISLLAAGDGTEIIHHRLERGSRWAIAPEDGWSALEYVYILSGELVWKSEQGDVPIRKGDSVSAHLITELAAFEAAEDTEFLYAASRPVFHNYSSTNQELTELSVTIEEKDGYTSDHCERIRQLAMRVGEEMKLSSYELFILNMAAFFHDIGKARVPESILNKPDKLTAEEYEIMKLHCTFGKQILHEKGLPDLILAGDIVEQHHERFDGSGYPFGLQGQEISPLAGIIAVVDSFDAMTADRIYHVGIPAEQALQEIGRCSGTKYDPEIVAAFMAIADTWTDKEGR